MRMQSHRNTIMLNTDYWLDVIIGDIAKLPHLSPDFHLDILHAFFSNFNQLLHRGRYDFMEHRREVKEDMIATAVADLEGSYVGVSGHPQPMEFGKEELEIIVMVICYLFDDMLLAIGNVCLDASTSLEFMRLVGRDVLFLYQSYRHPFRGPDIKQLGKMRQLPAEDPFHDLEPPRCWI